MNKNYILKQIKAHAGFVGNERAGELAKLVKSKEDIDVAINKSNCVKRRELQMEYLEEWQNRWNSSMKGRTVLGFIDLVNYNRIYADFYINQLITGHGINPSFQKNRFNREDKCLCGYRGADMFHIIVNCKKKTL